MNKILLPALFLLALFGPLCAYADPELKGVWRSDHDLTMDFQRKKVNMSPRQEAFLDQLMGHLTLTITADKVIATMPERDIKLGDKVQHYEAYTYETPYKIIYSGKNVIVETETEHFTGNQTVTIINFVEPDVMWVYVGGVDKAAPDAHFREYFRRVHP